MLAPLAPVIPQRLPEHSSGWPFGSLGAGSISETSAGPRLLGSEVEDGPSFIGNRHLGWHDVCWCAHVRRIPLIRDTGRLPLDTTIGDIYRGIQLPFIGRVGYPQGTVSNHYDPLTSDVLPATCCRLCGLPGQDASRAVSKPGLAIDAGMIDATRVCLGHVLPATCRRRRCSLSGLRCAAGPACNSFPACQSAAKSCLSTAACSISRQLCSRTGPRSDS